MEIAPIPNLIPLRVAASTAAPADLPITRAIDFRRQQNQDQDDAYTPGDGQPNQEHERQTVAESANGSQQAQMDDLVSDDPQLKSTINLFA